MSLNLMCIFWFSGYILTFNKKKNLLVKNVKLLCVCVNACHTAQQEHLQLAVFLFPPSYLLPPLGFVFS